MGKGNIMQCPSCGAEINITDKDNPKVECLYCGSVLDNVLYRERKRSAYKPKRVIPFSTTEDDFLKSFYRHLVNTDYVPTDIFEKIKVGKIDKVFLPMYRFNGSFSASWSCTEVIRRSRQKPDKTTEYYNEYHPASGVANGGFHFLYTANENDELPQGLETLPLPLKYNSQYATSSVVCDNSTFYEAEKSNARIFFADVDSHAVWNNGDIHDYIDNLAYKAAISAAPSSHQDFSYGWNCNTSPAELMMIPFWCITYEYEGKTYTFVEDGIGQNSYLDHPQDEGEKGKVDKVKVKRIFAIIESVIFLLIGIVGCFNAPSSQIPNFVILIIASIIYPLALWIGYKNEIEAIKDYAKGQRNNGLMKFLGKSESVLDIHINSASRKWNWAIVAIGSFIMCFLTIPKDEPNNKIEVNTPTESQTTESESTENMPIETGEEKKEVEDFVSVVDTTIVDSLLYAKNDVVENDSIVISNLKEEFTFLLDYMHNGDDCEYFLYDITNDGIPELWVIPEGSGLGVGSLIAYSFKGNRAKQIYKTWVGNSSVHKGDNYLLRRNAHMGYSSWAKIYYDGEIKEEVIFEEELDFEKDENASYTQPKEEYVELHRATEKETINRINVAPTIPKGMSILLGHNKTIVEDFKYLSFEGNFNDGKNYYPIMLSFIKPSVVRTETYEIVLLNPQKTIGNLESNEITDFEISYNGGYITLNSKKDNDFRIILSAQKTDRWIGKAKLGETWYNVDIKITEKTFPFSDFLYSNLYL